MLIFVNSMDWWHKLRRTWSLVPALLKLGKSVGGGCGRVRGGDGGLVKLRDEVQMCGYRDVQVMWNMLSIKQTEKIEGRGRLRLKVKMLKLKGKNGKRGNKQRPVWRLSVGLIIPNNLSKDNDDNKKKKCI